MAESGDGWAVMHRSEFEHPFPQWWLARRSLGLRSFGLNVAEIAPGEQIPEHDERARDHEEVFVVLEGDAVLVIEGEDHAAPAGTFARLDPAPRRTVRNDGDRPALVLIASAPRTSGYAPLDWA